MADDRGRKVMHYLNKARASGAKILAAMVVHLNDARI